jgi:hypothetical protein
MIRDYLAILFLILDFKSHINNFFINYLDINIIEIHQLS